MANDGLLPETSQTDNVRIRNERVWPSVLSIAIGEPSGHVIMPDEFVFIDRNSEPLLRLHIFYPPLEYHLKTEAIVWGDWVLVGFSARVVLIAVGDGRQHTIALSHAYPPDSLDYFCQFFSTGDIMLVCSGRRIFRISPDGEMLWTSVQLGIDGVLVHDVGSGVISGNGEWDPPGGWQPFSISLDTGLRISD